MSTVLARKLIVVTGKGGVGKSTIAAGLGIAAAASGLRTIVVELSGQRLLADMYGVPTPSSPGGEVELSEHLWSSTIDPDRTLLDWLSKLTGRISARVITSRATFQYFLAAAPGARELLSLVKVWELTQPQRRRGRSAYDLVILDAPATGHALAMLQSPSTFQAIARVGPLATQAQQVRELLEDPLRSAYLAVALGTELAVSETLELADGLRSQLGRELDAVVLNGVLTRRFEERELEEITAASEDLRLQPGILAAARTVHERARVQRNQLARLRRRDLRVLSVPFVFTAKLQALDLQSIAARLADGL